MTVSGSSSTSEPLSDQLRFLVPLAPDAFARKAIESAAAILESRTLPLRLNLFAASVRMLLEHIMGPLAPDAAVMACRWFKLVKGLSKPTRAQRVQYWLQGGLSDEYLKDELGLEPQMLRKQLMAAFEELSKHVHGRVDTLVEEGAAQDAEASGIVDAVAHLLETYHDCREALLHPLVEELDETAIEALLSETIQSVDELSSHHTIEEIYTDNTEVVAIGAKEIRYRASGTVSVTLQYGSNSDLRRGDGAELDESFPFTVTFDVDLADPRDLSNAEVVSGVDTSGWYGREGDDEYLERIDVDVDVVLATSDPDLGKWLAEDDGEGGPAF